MVRLVLGILAGWYGTRILTGASSLFSRDVEGPLKASGEEGSDESVELTPELESKLVEVLIEAFRRDVVEIYLAPYLDDESDLDVTVGVRRLSESGFFPHRADQAWDGAIDRLNDRLTKVQQRLGELPQEFWGAIGQGVRESGDVLITCHQSLKSWQ
jgi:hypothetical protein